jgi:outer membrane protein assembly factor BamB
VAKPKQILFGDLHVHTPFSFDAFQLSLRFPSEFPATICSERLLQASSAEARQKRGHPMGLSHHAFGLSALGALLLAAGLATAEPGSFDRGPGYAASPWATVHADSRNSDYVPIETPIALEQAWRALEGAGVWTAPSVGLDGTLFVTTGRGDGHSHLHAIAPDGSLRWQSAPQAGREGLDAGAVTSAPVIDAEGDVYVGDADEFWAFHPDGSSKWVSRMDTLGVEGPFVSGLIRGDLVGGISVHGQVVLLERATGALAAPVLDLPGGPSPEGPPLPDWTWEGLMDPVTKARTNDILMGHRYEVTNTPAVHPETGRIYLLAGGRSLEEGSFYGIDLVDGALRIAFETTLGPGTGTSPALSHDGTRLFAFEGDGSLIGLDAETGAVLFQREVGGVPASPSTGPNGEVYLLARERLVKVDGATGEILWERSYPEFAAAQLPTVSRFWPFVVSGEPVAAIDSVVTITRNAIWTSLVLGWELEVFGNELIHQRSTYLVALEPGTGDILASYPIPDTSEGGISVGPGGELYLDLLAVQASLAAGAPYRWLLPPAMHTPKPSAGIVAFRPRR